MAATDNYLKVLSVLTVFFNKLPVHFQSSQCVVLNVRALVILPMKYGATLSFVNGVKIAIPLQVNAMPHSLAL